MIREAAKLIQGGGGGQPHYAQAGGKNKDGLSALVACASLISITNNPSLFNPYSEYVFKYKGEMRDGAGRNRYRQLNVLSEMRSQGYLTQEEYDEAVNQEMVFKDGIDAADRWAVCESCGYAGTVSTFHQEGSHYYCPNCAPSTGPAMRQISVL